MNNYVIIYKYGYADEPFYTKHAFGIAVTCQQYNTVRFTLEKTILHCKAREQYLLTCEVSSYCLLAFQSRISCPTRSQHLMFAE